MHLIQAKDSKLWLNLLLISNQRPCLIPVKIIGRNDKSSGWRCFVKDLGLTICLIPRIEEKDRKPWVRQGACFCVCNLAAGDNGIESCIDHSTSELREKGKVLSFHANQLSHEKIRNNATGFCFYLGRKNQSHVCSICYAENQVH